MIEIVALSAFLAGIAVGIAIAPHAVKLFTPPAVSPEPPPGYRFVEKDGRQVLRKIRTTRAKLTPAEVDALTAVDEQPSALDIEMINAADAGSIHEASTKPAAIRLAETVSGISAEQATQKSPILDELKFEPAASTLRHKRGTTLPL